MIKWVAKLSEWFIENPIFNFVWIYLIDLRYPILLDVVLLCLNMLKFSGKDSYRGNSQWKKKNWGWSTKCLFKQEKHVYVWRNDRIFISPWESCCMSVCSLSLSLSLFWEDGGKGSLLVFLLLFTKTLKRGKPGDKHVWYDMKWHDMTMIV